MQPESPVRPPGWRRGTRHRAPGGSGWPGAGCLLPAAQHLGVRVAEPGRMRRGRPRLRRIRRRGRLLAVADKVVTLVREGVRRHGLVVIPAVFGRPLVPRRPFTLRGPGVPGWPRALPGGARLVGWVGCASRLGRPRRVMLVVRRAAEVPVTHRAPQVMARVLYHGPPAGLVHAAGRLRARRPCRDEPGPCPAPRGTSAVPGKRPCRVATWGEPFASGLLCGLPPATWGHALPAWAALAGPPPAATPAISVITPTAMAILVVQRIRIPVPFGQRLGFPPEALTGVILARNRTKAAQARRRGERA